MKNNIKRLKPTKSSAPDVALNSPMKMEELPFPYVYYPNHYGTFFMFSEKENSNLCFCLCSLDAIENHFLLRDFESNGKWDNNLVPAKLSSHFFPNVVSQKSIKEKNISKLLVFKEKLCHRCNLSTPTLRYCHEMYGGNFKQYYGWYINSNKFKFGFRNYNYIKNICPIEIKDLIDEQNKIREEINNILKIETIENIKKAYEINKKVNKIETKINKIVENKTREEFGYSKIGEGNISESILTNIIRGIFQNHEIINHYRPEWLDGLELDIYLPELNLGIEYQGQQHFYPIKIWGGENALISQRERDQKKRLLCKKLNIKLIEVDYTEPLELNYIKNKIYDILNSA